MKKQPQARIKLLQEQLDCIHSLKCYDCEFYRTQLLKKRSGQTCSWIFKHHNYRKWIDNDNSPVLWISGGPGFGKSVLSSVVSERLECGKPITLEDSYLVAYFFFDDKDERLKDIPAMLANVLGQLLKQDSELIKHFTQESEYWSLRDKTNCQWSPGMLERVFERITHSDNGRKIFLVIDALDECENTSLEDFLKSIQYMQDHFPCIGHRIKILLTSRPHTQVQPHISDAVEIALDSHVLETDITEYVKDGIARLDKIKAPIDLRDEIQKVLIKGANGVFLWVALMLDDLLDSKKTTRKALQEKVKTLPKDLHEVYRNILNKIEPDDLETAKTILQWVVRAARPLHVRELAVAIAVLPEHTSIASMYRDTDFNLESQIGRIFGPLIKIEEDTVHLVHQSAKDFLCDPNEINDAGSENGALHCTNGLMSSSDESHLQIASSCLAFLAFSEIKVDGQLRRYKDMMIFQSEMHKQCETRIICYAMQNWIDHVNKLGDQARICSLLLESFKNVAKYPDKLQLAYVGYMIHHRTPSQSRELEYSSALEMAAFFEHPGFVNILTDPAAVSNARGIIHGTALQNASRAGSDAIVQILLLSGADIHTVGESGRSLHLAAFRGHESIVRILIDSGADVNTVVGEFGSALQAAALEGHDSIVHLLIQNGGDVNTVGGEYGSALQAAAFMGHDSTVRLLIKNGAEVNTVFGEHNSSLHVAESDRNDSFANLLFDSSADVTTVGVEYGSALQAAAFGGHDSTVQILIDNGAEVNAVCGEYGSALLAASFEGHDSTVRLLIKHGADVNAIGGEYGSPLQAAALWGLDSTVCLLIDNGADVNTVSGEYGSALLAGALGGHDSTVGLLIDNGAKVNAVVGEIGSALLAATFEGHYSTVNLLINNGADVNAVGGKDGTALHVAAFEGHDTIVRLLIENRANVNVVGGPYGSALQAAAFEGHDPVVWLLINSGAGVGTVGGLYGTALQAAAFGGHHSIVQILIRYGADVNAVGGEDGTALHVAAFEGHDSIVRLLIENRANVNVVGGSYGSALQAAAFGGHDSVVRLLINSGAGVKTVSGLYGTALQAALREGNDSTVRLLLDSGA